MIKNSKRNKSVLVLTDQEDSSFLVDLHVKEYGPDEQISGGSQMAMILLYVTQMPKLDPVEFKCLTDRAMAFFMDSASKRKSKATA